MADELEIVSFDEAHGPAFRALNLAWIRLHWEPEPMDFRVLDNPQVEIIDKGGDIAIATHNGQVVGTCALVKIDNTTFELAKMAVAETARGRGIGERLGQRIIEQARIRGAERLCLESNTVLEPAINLYRKLGFTPVAKRSSHYDRCNIQMTLELAG